MSDTVSSIILQISPSVTQIIDQKIKRKWFLSIFFFFFFLYSLCLLLFYILPKKKKKGFLFHLKLLSSIHIFQIFLLLAQSFIVSGESWKWCIYGLWNGFHKLSILIFGKAANSFWIRASKTVRLWITK